MTRWLPRIAVASLFVLLAFSAAFADSSKLDASARAAIYWLRGGAAIEGGDITGPSSINSVSESGELDCLIIGTASRAQLEAAGARIRFEFPNGVYTAFIPVDAIDAVAALGTVSRIEGAQTCQAELDNGVPSTGATMFRGPGPAFTGLNGAGVIVGDVDTGVDYKHDNFKDAGGNTRFLSIWDETDAVGPAGAAPYGSEWLPADINGATAREKDTNGHGSHTMGIAGGDGSSAPGGVAAPAFTYVGMAPMADLIMVRASTTGSFSSTSLLDGIAYIFGRGTFYGKPSVVNMSIGNATGPKDGSSTFETTVDALCGPGKTVVFSAGNNGGQAIHGAINATGGGTNMTVSFVGTGTTLNRRFIYDGYYNATEGIDVTVTTPNGTVIGPIAFGTNNAAYPGTATANGAVYVENGMFTTSNGSREVYIDVINNVGAAMNMAGTWTYTFTAVSLGAANGKVDMFQFFLSSTAFTANTVIGNDPAHMLINGLSTGFNTFSTAAWVSKQAWTDCRAAAWNSPTNTVFTGTPPNGNLATFSSTGPTRDGRPKPDVAAPGTAVASCRSGDIAPPASCPSPTTNLHGFTHVINAGTSMAAPHLTGAIGLLYQKYGALTPAQLRTLIQTRAVVDAFVTGLGAVPNPSFGYGKLFLGDMSDPLCAVTYPNGGETLIVGTGANLTWNASDVYQGVTGVDLEISFNGGGSWTTIATNQPNTGIYPWIVTGPPTATALLRVTARDAANNQGVDVSDQLWTIDQPVGTVMTEFRAEPTDQGVRLVWQFADPSSFSRVALERAVAGNGPWTELGAELSTEGASTVAVDRTAQAGQTYFYRLAVTYASGGLATFGPLSTTAGRPITEFALSPVSPNPTDGPAVIEYAVPKRANVTVAMFDLQGREVATLASGPHGIGRYQLTWSGEVDGGRAHAGVYFVRMVSDKFNQTRRVVLSH